jgi:hypothetical protein
VNSRMDDRATYVDLTSVVRSERVLDDHPQHGRVRCRERR